MGARHFLSISDLGPENLCRLVNKSLAMAEGRAEYLRPLQGKIVGTYFKGPSTRTRTAFSAGALRLGGQLIQYSQNDLQVATGESFQDTGRVLSGFLNVFVMRSNESLAEMVALAQQTDMAVINAMSENEHPTQAIADLVTIREALGRLQDVHVLYVGDGNNTACALAFAVAQTSGMRLTLITPQQYGLPDRDLEGAIALASKNEAAVEQHHNIDKPPKNVDVVYTTRWETMGVKRQDFGWRAKFVRYRVTSELMRQVSKPSQTIFLHDLPAVRGEEVEDEVLDGPQSRAFRQAKHKLHSAMAILDWCIAE